jgi:hypothetical protein
MAKSKHRSSLTGQTSSGLFCFLLFLTGLFTACDKIDPPYKKTIAKTATFANSRNILLEEFTGHTCVNCPAAAVVVEHLADTVFPGRIIPVAIHALSLANPTVAPFTYNFTTPPGNDYATFFGLSADPSGMVNRTSYNGNVVMQGTGAWGSAIQSCINDTAGANINITVSNYNPVQRQASFYVSVNWLQNLKGNYNICLEYTEDSIINTQLMPNGIVNTNFVFMHVLRGTLNGDWGTQIASNPAAYTVWSTNYFCTLDSALIPKNCHIVAYVTNNASNEVIQAFQTNLMP